MVLLRVWLEDRGRRAGPSSRGAIGGRTIKVETKVCCVLVSDDDDDELQGADAEEQGEAP